MKKTIQPEIAQHIANLEECLAGFMAIALLNDVFMTEDMKQWAHDRLVGKARSPAAVWRKVYEFNRKEGL